MAKNFVVAWYERTDGAVGGILTSGELVRSFATTKNENDAYRIANRANRLMHRIQKTGKTFGIYYAAHVWEESAPSMVPYYSAL